MWSAVAGFWQPLQARVLKSVCAFAAPESENPLCSLRVLIMLEFAHSDYCVLPNQTSVEFVESRCAQLSWLSLLLLELQS